jgi:hypothetical protein
MTMYSTASWVSRNKGSFEFRIVLVCKNLGNDEQMCPFLLRKHDHFADRPIPDKIISDKTEP